MCEFVLLDCYFVVLGDGIVVLIVLCDCVELVCWFCICVGNWSELCVVL